MAAPRIWSPPRGELEHFTQAVAISALAAYVLFFAVL
jgi:hypothetical protein